MCMCICVYMCVFCGRDEQISTNYGIKDAARRALSTADVAAIIPPSAVLKACACFTVRECEKADEECEEEWMPPRHAGQSWGPSGTMCGQSVTVAPSSPQRLFDVS